MGYWICEIHPELDWPHDDCPGPGMPVTNRARIIAEDKNPGLNPSDDFLKAVGEFNPELARPELWDNTAFESFLPDGDPNPLHLIIHQMMANMVTEGVYTLEPGLIIMYMLGYYNGQRTQKESN